MFDQKIVSLFRNLDSKNPWRLHCQGNTVDCSFNPISTSKNDARNNFGLDHREEILFLRDTSFWNSSDQGLVLTDAGLYCIPDNDSPDDKIVFSWEIVKKVVYQDACLYFHGYDEGDVCQIHVSFFTKNAEEQEFAKLGLSIAGFLSRVATSVKHVDPFEENEKNVDDLLAKEDADGAISLLRSLISQDDGTYKAYWYYRLTKILLFIHGDDEQIAKYCLEGLKYCEEGSPLSVWLKEHHRSAYSALHIQETIDLDEGSTIASIPATKLNRWESLWVSQNTTDEAFPDGRPLKEIADADFEFANDYYCKYFTRQPYNERKVLLVVKDYTDLRQDSLCVMRKSDIPSDMSFPIGHPQEDQIYVGHPFIPAKYVPFEEYQLEFIEDKVREFTWLMQCMGATKISISAKNDNEQSGDFSSNRNASGNSSYRIASASGSYSGSSKGSFAEQISKAISLNQVFNPTKAPFVPDGLVWYQNEPSWQRLVNQRMTGSLMHASESIESRKSNMVNGSELKTIKAEFRSLVSLDGEWTREDEAKLQQQENATLTFEIDFAPIGSLGSDAAQIEGTSLVSIAPLAISTDEQEYLDEVRECLEDGEIGPRERRLLDKLASKLGISPERAAELEASLSAPVLTDDEKEYLEEVQAVLADGEISEKERRLLDKLRKMLDISEERAKEIEQLAAN